MPSAARAASRPGSWSRPRLGRRRRCSASIASRAPSSGSSASRRSAASARWSATSSRAPVPPPGAGASAWPSAGRIGPAAKAVASLVKTPAPEQDGLLTLAQAAEAREGHAVQHIRRLEMTSRRLALRAGMSERQAADVARAAMFHDLGKLRIPERILLKPEPLDQDEWTIVRNHPIWTEEALAGGEHLALAREVGRWHHENWDGTGYPDGLAGDRIPLAARIVRITDAFDAMTNRRPYQRPVSFEAALEELQATARQDFDPDLVRHFVDLVRNEPVLRTELTELRED